MTLAVSIAQSGANNVTMRNRIINGGMTIAQRGTSTTTNFGVWMDMWRYSITGPSAMSIAQSSTAPAGFSNSLLVTITTGAAIGSSLNYVSQSIEGYNCADLGFGTADANTVTISFWVRSSITGTFGGSLRNYGPASFYRGYPFTYTINSANTWEKKTVTIVGDGITGAGQWNTTNNGSLTVFFDLGTQSAYTAAANAWITQNVVGATGTQTSLVATSGATWYVTGVQLEEGTTATAFEQRLYGQELALCQRYCIVYGGSQQYEHIGQGSAYSTSSAAFDIPLPVEMRTTPSITASGAWYVSDMVSGYTVTSFGLASSGQESSTKRVAAIANAASTPLTVYRPYYVYALASTASRFIVSAEL